ncbi:MAG: shikimate dehydrogenase [Candidatus Omnitrophota bacterium]
MNGHRLRYGLLGYPISRSPSPAMQQAAFRSSGLKAVYEIFEEPSLENARLFFESLPSQKIAGLNVTVPYKAQVYRWMVERGDALDNQVQLTQSVNTVVVDGGKYKGFSTDGYGFIASLKERNVSVQAKKALILGAGGASQAIAVALKQEGAGFVGYYEILDNRFYLLKEIVAKGEADERRIEESKVQLKDLLERHMPTTDMLINATPVSDRSFVADDFLRSGLLVYDLIYHKEGTALLKQARAKGLLAIDGRGMLLHQGARAFELWTGKKAPLSVMQKALEEVLS